MQPQQHHGPISGVKVTGIADPQTVFRVTATDSKSGEDREIAYTNCKVVGNGSFGVVFSATLLQNGDHIADRGRAERGSEVAIKKVGLDPRFMNRELKLMRQLRHPNIVDLIAFFHSTSDDPRRKDETFLNLVLEFIPQTLHGCAKHYARMKQAVPSVQVKLVMYQLLRSLAYIHSVGVCHRDVKPPNVLYDPSTGIVKLIDFGSAKMIVPGQPNVSYIASRYYRAPECIFGSTEYTNQIDVWAAGCVMAELMLGQPIFLGESGIDQLVEIIKILGTPTKQQIVSMNPHYKDHQFPQIKKLSMTKVFRPRTPHDAIDLVERLLEYTPSSRLTAVEAMVHPFFDELRKPGGKLPSGQEFPPLFNFTRGELSARPDLIAKLVPSWYAETLRRDQDVDVTNFMAIPLAELRLKEA